MPAEKIIRITRNKPGKGVMRIRLAIFEEAKKELAKKKISKKNE